MSETLLKIALAELSLLRIRCTKCELTVEVAADRLEHYGQQHPACHHCGASLVPQVRGPNLFSDLATALQRLKQEQGVSIEFVIPTDPAPRQTA